MLDQVVFRTDDYPVEDRVEAWRDCMSRTMAPMQVTPTGPRELRVLQRVVPLGGATVWPADTTSCTYSRSHKQIRQADPELVHLTLMAPSCGPLVTRHAGVDATHEPGDLYMLDSSLPIVVTSRHPGDGVVGVGVEVPRAALPSPGRSGLAPLLGRPLSGRSGFGALLAHFLTTLAVEPSAYRHSDAPRLATLLTDLVSGLVANELDAHAHTSPETRDRNLRLQVQAYIQRNLHDPRLGPATVAAHHHLSLRQLHRLFEGEELTVSGHIRHSRLERARRALANATPEAATVGAVAARSGFSSGAHFSRAFRHAFGSSPSEYRRAAQERSTPPGGPSAHGGDGAPDRLPAAGPIGPSDPPVAASR
ncbi:helix-turn-helix domain-containing protein [Streptomyces lonarensis]|uniref:AraC family transcriptional regulator n=1 Tax=Streptomyces lonarensis TaxID=700599 RepID=A0A7X6D162_9ACTN|nr:AraC family transcriptional regulator [Streptomyces lonarensis]NJQ06318.1 AraC family transcriptional regulator [Streptomyces lonarensis]